MQILGKRMGELRTIQYYKKCSFIKRSGQFYSLAKNNSTKCLPKILKGEPYKTNIVYSTLAEQEEAEKIENFTISEIKQKIYVFENFSNKNMWQHFYKKEAAGKTRAVHIDFLNTLLEIIEDEE